VARLFIMIIYFVLLSLRLPATDVGSSSAGKGAVGGVRSYPHTHNKLTNTHTHGLRI